MSSDDDKTAPPNPDSDNKEERARKILFPRGIPRGLPHIDDCRFRGHRKIIKIIEETDEDGERTIRYELKDGSVFWKDPICDLC